MGKKNRVGVSDSKRLEIRQKEKGKRKKEKGKRQKAKR